MHTTDILLSHERIEETTRELVSTFNSATTCLIGGDHSVTACAVRGVKKAYPRRANRHFTTGYPFRCTRSGRIRTCKRYAHSSTD